MTQADSDYSFAANAGLGFCVAPLCGHLLFAFFILLSEVQYSVGISNDVLELLAMTSTVGLFATYFFFALLGLPTAFVLHYRSQFRLWTFNVAGLIWTVVLLAALWLTSGLTVWDLFMPNELSSLLTTACLLAPFVLMIGTVFYWIVARKPEGRFGLRSLLFLVAIFAASLSAALVIRAAIHPRVVACVRHPNGARLLVTQDWGGEPFDTCIFLDEGDGSWRWYYYEHEDWYWGEADSRIVEDEIHLFAFKRSVVINTLTGEFKGERLDGKEWTSERSTRTDRLPPVSSKMIDRMTQPLGIEATKESKRG